MSAKPPEQQQPPMWAPTPSPTITATSTSTSSVIDFSPPLIAMVVVAAAAFLLVTYSRLISRRLLPPFRRVIRRYRLWRRRRLLRPHFPPSDMDSPPPHLFDSPDGFYVYSPYGLDDSVINNIPLTIFKPSKLGFFEVHDFHDCAVCLLDFEDGDYMRTLPHCCHSFHVDCIDIWLRSHASCPLCRAGVFFPPPPMTPLMAARIRPSLDEGILLDTMCLAPLPEQRSGEIRPATTDELFSPQRRTIQSEDHQFNRRELDLLLQRSYSFSFATTSQTRRRSMWMKRPSSTPFRSIAKSRGTMTKSPGLFRRRNMLPMSESWASVRWSRRMKYGTSSVMGVYSSSRMRLGDPEALISPERYGRG